MSYATEAQLVERYGFAAIMALTDRDPLATGAIDSAVVDRALADTDALIDGYLRNRYDLPLLATPPLLTDVALSIAFYRLHIAQPDDKVVADYRDARALLDRIANGAVALPIGSAVPAVTAGSGARVTDRDRPISADTMKGFI